MTKPISPSFLPLTLPSKRSTPSFHSLSFFTIYLLSNLYASLLPFTPEHFFSFSTLVPFHRFFCSHRLLSLPPSLPVVVPVAPGCIWSLLTPDEPPVLLTGPGLLKPAEPGQTNTQMRIRIRERKKKEKEKECLYVFYILAAANTGTQGLCRLFVQTFKDCL